MTNPRPLRVGVDIGGSKIAVLVVDSAGTVIGRELAPSVAADPDLAIEQIAAVIRSAVTSAGATMDAVEAIGVGVPGRVDRATGLDRLRDNVRLAYRGDARAGGLGLNDRGHLKTPGHVHDARQREAVEDVFSRWTVISRTKRVERIADSVHVVPELAQHAAPSLGARQHVGRGQVEAVGDIALHAQHHGVVARPVVRFEDGEIGHVGHLGLGILREQR